MSRYKLFSIEAFFNRWGALSFDFFDFFLCRDGLLLFLCFLRREKSRRSFFLLQEQC